MMLNTVESRDYAPPFFCMLALGKSTYVERGFNKRGIVTFPYDDLYRPTNATWARDLSTFSGCLMDKTREKRQSKAYYDTNG
jgi:hypothetical protein